MKSSVRGREQMKADILWTDNRYNYQSKKTWTQKLLPGSIWMDSEWLEELSEKRCCVMLICKTPKGCNWNALIKWRNKKFPPWLSTAEMVGLAKLKRRNC